MSRIEFSSSVSPSVEDLCRDKFASRLAGHDAGLWGPSAREEASIRLGWVDVAETSRPLIHDIAALRSELLDRGLDRVVLCGMGGSSLAPEVICHSAAVPLTVLDSTSPDQVRTALTQDLDRTVVVVSSKSGTTMETDSQRRAFEQALRDIGRDPTFHIIVVTDPGSPLDDDAAAAGYRVFHADPQVGGRYSALTAFGLVPSGLAGADIGALLDDAASVMPTLFADALDNPALQLGALLGEQATKGLDKLVLVDHKCFGLGAWIEQLVAESTGKDGRGILPVVVTSPDSPDAIRPPADSLVVALDGPMPDVEVGLSTCGPLGAQILLWEIATTVAGRALDINPFDQPDVESTKATTRELLASGAPDPAPTFIDGPTSGFAVHGFDEMPSTASAAVHSLIEQVRGDNYLAVQAYLDRERFPEFETVRDVLAERLGRPVTFGWGPRFLHSTGQYHKGGPQNGVFLQITSEPIRDLAIAGQPFSFQSLIVTQAVADAKVLADLGRPVLRLHLSNADRGVPYLSGLLT